VDNQAERNASIKKLAELIKEIKYAMLTTTESDGSLRSRPMQVQQVEFDGDLWFFTGASSPKVSEIQRDHQVNVSFAAPNKDSYVSMSGRANLVRDRQKIDELWNDALKAWFPKGKDDPEVALLKVNVEQAEYWDEPGGKVVELAGFVKALVTGKRADTGENEKLNLEESSAYQSR
jgi:general stress protein 26